MIFTVISISMSILGQLIMQQVVDKIVIGVKQPNGEILRYVDKLIPLISLVMIISLLKTSIFYIMVILFEKVSQEVVYNIRKYLYTNISIQDMSFFAKYKIGDLMTRLTGDIDTIRHTVAWVFRMFIESLVMFTVTIIYFFTIDWIITLIISISIPILYFIIKKVSNTVVSKYEILREKLSSLNSCAQENISGNRVVKAFAKEDYEKEKFNKKNLEYKEASKIATLTWLKYYPFIEFISQSLPLITLFVGGYFIIIERITAGELTVFLSLSWAISNPIKNFGVLLNDIQRFFTSSSKVIEIYYSYPNIISRYNSIKREMKSGSVEFKNISLEIQNNIVLDNINLKVNSGETVAIMGNTGYDKTSLVSLIPRLYDVFKG